MSSTLRAGEAVSVHRLFNTSSAPKRCNVYDDPAGRCCCSSDVDTHAVRTVHLGRERANAITIATGSPAQVGCALSLAGVRDVM